MNTFKQKALLKSVHFVVSVSMLLNVAPTIGAAGSAPAAIQVAANPTVETLPDVLPLVEPVFAPTALEQSPTWTGQPLLNKTYLPLVTQNHDATPVPGATLQKTVYPWLASAGDVVTYTLKLDNTGGIPIQGGVLVDHVPDEIEVLEAPGADYNVGTRELRWDLALLNPGQGVTTTIRARLADQIASSVIVNRATFTGQPAATVQAAQDVVTATAQADVYVGGVTMATITPEGGSLFTHDGLTSLQFPAGAFAETVVVSITTPVVLSPTLPRMAMYREYGLDVQIRTLAGELPITTSLHPVDIVLDYTPVPGIGNTTSQQLLQFYHYNPGQETWQRLYTTVSPQTGVLTSTTSGFSLFSFATGTGGQLGDYAQPWSPTVMDYQVDLFTGAAQWTYPIQTPAGRAGMTPRVQLSYNSAIVDEMRGRLNPQASWVGAGWELEMGYIARKIDRDANGVPQCTNEYHLVLDGVSSKLIHVGGGLYRTENERFWKIRRVTTGAKNRGGDYWLVWTRDGTEYRFGYSDETAGANSSSSAWWLVSAGCDGDPDLDPINWRWNLDHVKDTNGNVVRLDYRAEANNFRFVWYDPVIPWALARYYYSDYNPCAADGTTDCWTFEFDGWGIRAYHDIWVMNHGYIRGGHLSLITYNWPPASGVNSIYGVIFKTEERQDYPDVLGGPGPRNTCEVQTFWSKYRLDRVNVTRVGGLIQGYDLNYMGYSATSSGASVLRSIRVTGEDGVTSLPSITFNYHIRDLPSYRRNGVDGGWGLKPWLSGVENGYGGDVAFNYTGPLGMPWTQNGQIREPKADSNGRYWYRYRVREATANPGTGRLMRTVYEYLSSSGSGFHSGTWQDDEFRGHPRVRVKQRIETGDIVSYSDHYFHQGNGGTATGVCGQDVPDREGMQGREYRLVHYGASGNQLAENRIAHQFTDYGSGRHFVAVSAACEYAEPGSNASRRTGYAYDGYGNVTHVREYDLAGATVPYRTTMTDYVVSTDRWIVDRPLLVRSFAGDVDGTEIAHVGYYYDRDASGDVRAWGAEPIQGNVVQVDQLNVGTDEHILTEYWYDRWGNRTIAEDALNRRTTTDYETTYGQFPIRTCNALGQCSYVQYYGVNQSTACIGSGYYFGAPCRTFGSNGPDTASLYTYDAFGRLTSLVRPGDSPALPTTAFEYHDGTYLWITARQREMGGQSGTLDALTYYDGLGRPIQTRSEVQGGWLVTSQGYDGLGRAAFQYLPLREAGSGRTAPSGPHTATSYDALGRAVRVDNPDGTHIEASYWGWQTTAIDANRHQRVSTADAFGRLVRVEEYTGTVESSLALYATTTYTYDARDSLVGAQDTLGNTTVITYDGLGRKVAMDDPDMGLWTFGYDTVGNLTTQTDALSQTIILQYDDLDRVSAKSSGGQVLAEYGYDEGDYGIGYRTVMTDSTGVTHWTYDERGRPVEERRHLYGLGEYTTRNTYDAADRLVTMTYPDGEVVAQTYDAGGRPATLSSSLGDVFVRGTTYNTAGQLEALDLGNDLQTTYSYDSLNLRLTQLQVTDQAMNLQDLVYGYDDVGNVLSIVNGVLGETQYFAYDPLDRLIGAEAIGGPAPYEESYVYDEVGSITRKGEAEYAYEDAAHVHAATRAGDDRFEYDANGNMTLRVEISDTQAISYYQQFNVENRLAVVTATNGLTQTVTRFDYDGDGARIQKSTEQETTVYIGGYYEEQLPSVYATADEMPQADAAQLFGVMAPLAADQQTFADEFSSCTPNGWSWSLGSSGSPDPVISWCASDGQNVFLHLTNPPYPQFSDRFPLVGRNDAFGGSGTSRYYIEIRFRHPVITGYGTSISVGSAAFSNDWRLTGEPATASNVLKLDRNETGLRIRTFGEKVDQPPSDTGWHTLRLMVVNGHYALWLDGDYRRSGVASVTPQSIWFGNPVQVSEAFPWTTKQIDYVRVGIPETDPPADWQDLSPAGWTNDTTPDVTIQARDTGTGLDVGAAQYQYSTDGGSSWSGWLPAASSGVSGTVTFETITASAVPFSQASDTLNRIRFQVQDMAGNWGSSPVYMIPVDIVPPTSTSVIIEDGAAWAADRAVTLTLSASDPMPGSGVSQVRLHNDGEAWSAWQPYATSITWTLPITDGTHTVYAQFRDAAGNESSPPTSDAIGLDTQGPAGQLSINDGALTTGSRGVTLTLGASDPAPGSGVAQMRLRNDGDAWPAWESYSAATRVWTLGDQDGERAVHVQFRDVAGNVVTYTDTILLDRVPPSLVVTQPGDGAMVSKLPLAVWGQSEASATIEVQVVETGWHASLELTSPDFTFNLPSGALAEGENALIVTAADLVRNTTVVTRTVHFDPTGPVIGALAPQGAVDDAQPTLSASFSVTGTSAISPSSAIVRLDGRDVTAEATVTAAGFDYTPDAPLVQGLHQGYVRVCDVAGNCSDARWPFTVDLATWITITHPAGNLNRTGVTVEGEAEPGVTVTLHVNGSSSGSVQADSASGHYAIAGVTLNAGANTLAVTATDALGHTAAATRTVQVNLADPWADARATPATFSPGGAIGFTTFAFTATAPAGETLSAWQFTVSGSSGVIAQTGGLGTPPSSWVWDGLNGVGQPLPEGDYGYTLAVTATNGSAYLTPQRVVRIDRTPPSAPVITWPVSGSLSSQGLVWVEGAAEPGTFITLQDGGIFTTTLGTPAGEDGRWAGTYPLHGGVNRVTAVANDTTGVASPPSNEVVVIHQVHPPLYDAGAEPGTVAAGEEVTLWADVRGVWPLEGAPAAAAWATPPFGPPLALTGTMPSEPLWRWQAAWTVPAGAASQDTVVRYGVIDEDNLSGEGEVGLAIRNAPPAPHIVWPAEDLMVTPQVVLAGRVESAEGLTVRVYEGAQMLAETRSTGWDPTVGINWQVAITLTGEGPHALRAEAVNDYGLVSALSPTRTLTLDLNPPTVALAALPPYTNAPHLELAWQGADVGSGVTTYGLEHSLDGGPWAEWASGGAGYTGAVYPLHQDATYRFRVRARDGAGREGLSEEREVVADQTAPGLALALDGSDPHVHVAGSTIYYGPSSGAFTVTASLGDATAGLAEVVLPDTTSAGATYALSGVANASRGRVYTFTSGSAFSAAVSVTATDRAGNVTVRPLSVLRDATPPAIRLAAVERTYTTTFQVSWWASDAGSGVAAGYDLDVSEDGGPWQRILSQTTATSYWYTGQLGHSYRFRVAAVDNVGNAGSAEAETWVPVTTKYYYHGGQRVAMRSGQTGAVYYLHTDHLGSTGLSTGQDGGVHSRQLYAPYGETRWTQGTLPTARQFTGQIHDVGTGLYYYNARYYHPALGRFISADTIVPGPGDPQAFNRYSYVLGNPIKLIDPSGHQSSDPGYWIGLYGTWLDAFGVTVDFGDFEPTDGERLDTLRIILGATIKIGARLQGVLKTPTIFNAFRAVFKTPDRTKDLYTVSVWSNGANFINKCGTKPKGACNSGDLMTGPQIHIMKGTLLSGDETNVHPLYLLIHEFGHTFTNKVTDSGSVETGAYNGVATTYRYSYTTSGFELQAGNWILINPTTGEKGTNWPEITADAFLNWVRWGLVKDLTVDNVEARKNADTFWNNAILEARKMAQSSP